MTLKSFFGKMKKIKILSPAELEKLATVHDGVYKFDASRISFDQFPSWVRSISHYGNTFRGLKISLDLLQTIERKKAVAETNGNRNNKLGQSKQTVPLALNNSAIKRNPGVSKEVIGAVSKMLLRPGELEFLKFRSFPISFSEIDNLSSAIYQNNSLRTLRFCNVQIGDDGFERLCRCLRKRSIIDLQCRKCGLTDKSAAALRSLLQFQPFIQYEYSWEDSLLSDIPFDKTKCVCLQTIDLRDNYFTFQFVNEIEDSLYNECLSILDLRGNSGISDTTIAPVLKKIRTYNSPHKMRQTQAFGQLKPKKISLQILVGISSYPKESHQKNSIERPHPTIIKTIEPPTEIKRLEEENRQLKIIIDSLQNNTNIVSLEKDLYIVGPQAQELVTHIRCLDKFLATSERGPAPFLLETRTSPQRNLSKHSKPMKSKRRSKSVSPHQKTYNFSFDSTERKAISPQKKRASLRGGSLW